VDVDKFLDRVYRRSHSVHSLRFYRSGIRKLERFCSEVYGEGLEKVIEGLRKGTLDVYDLLDQYASWMDGQGLKGKTQHDYMVAAKKLLRFFDIEILEEKFREKVVLARPEKIMDEAPTKEQLRMILARCNPRLKALILTMASSGMRLGEALSLKVKHVDFDSKPVRIVIPARRTKNARSRECYITDEAADAIRKCLGDKIRDPEAYLFGFGEDIHMAEKKAIQMFRRVMKHFPELDEKVDGHRVHKIHLYSFRKFFYSTVVGIIGETAAHALMGHGSYMDTYYKRPMEERRADYLKCVPKLTVMKGSEEDPELLTLKTLVESGVLDLSRRNVREYLIRKLGIRELDVKVAKLKGEEEAYIKAICEKLGIDPMRIEAFRPKGNDDPKLIVSECELERYLAEGWDVQLVLPSGRILIRKG